MTNLPNLLTYSRIVLSGVFMYFVFGEGLVMKVTAALVFLVACLTDTFDGYFARKFNQVTPLGQLLDPIADKILNFSAFISFVEMGYLPAWMVILMIAREALITGFRLIGASQGTVVPADRLGKHKTVLQICGVFAILILLILIELGVGQPRQVYILAGVQLFMVLVVAVTLISGITFTINHWRKIQF